MLTYRQFLNESRKQFKSPFEAYRYANYEARRVPELEDFIRTNSEAATLYALNVIHGPWPEAEDLISKGYPNTAYSYTKYVHNGRFSKGEDTMKVNDQIWGTYKMFLHNHGYNDKEKWEWLHKGLNENTVEILDELGMKSDMQEYILQHRPDLAGLIKNLKPELAEKYQHEIEMANVDL
jgi:hypothetical protein